MTAVYGRLLVDLTSAVDAFGFLDARQGASCVPVLPEGADVELGIGDAHGVIGAPGELVRVLRPAGRVCVTGTSAGAVGDLTRALRVAMRAEALS